MEDEAVSLEIKIEELLGELHHVKEKRDGLILEARRWAEERDRLHRNFKELLSKVVDLKKTHRAVNKKISVLRVTIREAKEEYHKKSVQLRNLNNKLRDFIAKGSYINSEDLEDEIEEIEWKIQTTPLSLGEEKILVEQVRSLESQLMLHKQAKKLVDEKKSLKDKIDSAYKEIVDLAEQGKTIHASILESSKRLDEIKSEADKMHKNYLEYKDKAQKFHLNYSEILTQIKSLRQELDKIEETKKAKRMHEFRSDLEKKALEKLRNRKRLTLNEFKILAEKGEI